MYDCNKFKKGAYKTENKKLYLHDLEKICQIASLY